MRDQNRYGLSRHIPVQVTKEVRQRCGFGCVVCGAAVVDYDHFDPEFKDAKKHDPDGIILLCQNCHRRKGSFLARSAIAQCAQNPYCLQEGHSWEKIDVTGAVVSLGPVTAFHSTVALQVGGENLIWFNPPEGGEGPPRLNLIVRDQSGSTVIQVKDNIWQMSNEASDVVLTSGGNGGRIKVDDEDGVVFDVSIVPPNLITVGAFRTWHRGSHYAVGRDTKGETVLSKDGIALMPVGSENNIALSEVALSLP